MVGKQSFPDQGNNQEQPESQLQGDTLIRLVNKSRANVSKDECYPDFICKAARDYCFVDESQLLEKEIQKIWSSLSRNYNAEKFYS